MPGPRTAGTRPKSWQTSYECLPRTSDRAVAGSTGQHFGGTIPLQAEGDAPCWEIFTYFMKRSVRLVKQKTIVSVLLQRCGSARHVQGVNACQVLPARLQCFWIRLALLLVGHSQRSQGIHRRRLLVFSPVGRVVDLRITK